MNWDDCEGIWKRQALPLGAGASTAELGRSFEAKSRKLAASLFLRDVLEASAGLLVAGVFAVIWWHIGAEGWPMAGAMLLVLGVTGFFVRERLRSHRRRPSPEAPMLVRLDAEIAELRHQSRLLRRVGSWYLAPCALAVVCCGAAVTPRAIRELPPGFFAELLHHPLLLAGMVGFIGIVLPMLFVSVWVVSRRAVRNNIEPRLEELERLRQELVAE